MPDALPQPKVSGSVEQIRVSIPNALVGTRYYLVLRARDEASNWSSVSNNVSFIYGAEVGVDENSITLVR